ncbi:MAG: glycosyltransferase [Proteobacteria bacterium]|nr:glycosyltransferase [Pseudomonadota bacterium]
MKLVILDPDLATFGGHNFNYLEGIVGEARSRGIDTRVFGYRGIKPEVAKALGAVGHFAVLGRAALTDVDGGPKIRAAWTHVVLNAVFARDLQPLTQELGPETLVLVPAASSRQLFALAQWLALIAPPSLPQLVCLFRYDLAAYAGEEEFLGVPAAVLASLKRPAILCCETEANALAHQTALQLRFLTMPFPFPVPERVPSNPKTGDRPRVGYFGDGRYMKGFHLLPGLAEMALAANAAYRLWVQTFDTGDDPDAKGHLLSLRRLAARDAEAVVLLDGTVDSARYRRFMLDCQIVLLPYHAPTYRRASSAIFCEAVSAGRVVVVPEETWMCEALRRLGVEPLTFRDWSVPALDGVLRQAASDLPRRRQEAERIAVHWNAGNGPKPVLDQLTRWYERG